MAIGLPLAMAVLNSEDRLAVVLAYSLASGHCLQIVLLILLWGLVPLGAALWLTLAATLSLGALLAIRRSGSCLHRPMRWGMGSRQTGTILVLAMVFAFMGHRVFTAAYASGWDAEALFQHSGLVAWLARSTFPPASPLEPDDPLRYRIGLHALAAAFSSASGALPPDALASTVGLLLALTAIFLGGASLRLLGSPLAGMLASVLGLFGGSLLPYYLLVQTAVAGVTPDWPEQEWVGGHLWHGNELEMIQVNVSMAMGYTICVAALWLCWEAVVQRKAKQIALLPAIGSLAALGLFNEVYFAGVLVGLGGICVV